MLLTLLFIQLVALMASPNIDINMQPFNELSDTPNKLIPFDSSHFNRTVDQLPTEDQLSIAHVDYVKTNQLIHRGRKTKMSWIWNHGMEILAVSGDRKVEQYWYYDEPCCRNKTCGLFKISGTTEQGQQKTSNATLPKFINGPKRVLDLGRVPITLPRYSQAHDHALGRK